MENKQIVEKLTMLMNTLGTITVSGQNVVTMYNCMNFIAGWQEEIKKEGDNVECNPVE